MEFCIECFHEIDENIDHKIFVYKIVIGKKTSLSNNNNLIIKRKLSLMFYRYLSSSFLKTISSLRYLNQIYHVLRIKIPKIIIVSCIQIPDFW